MSVIETGISARQKRFLQEKGIRIGMVEQQVDEIVRMVQNNGFTLDESALIAKSLANSIEQARYHPGGTLLSEIDVKKDC